MCLKIYLFISKWGMERETEKKKRERDIFPAGLLLKCLQMSGLRQVEARTQESHPRLPYW